MPKLMAHGLMVKALGMANSDPEDAHLEGDVALCLAVRELALLVDSEVIRREAEEVVTMFNEDAFTKWYA